MIIGVVGGGVRGWDVHRLGGNEVGRMTSRRDDPGMIRLVHCEPGHGSHHEKVVAGQRQGFRASLPRDEVGVDGRDNNA